MQNNIKVYDKSGAVHTIHTEYNFGRYIIYLDGAYYTAADDRIELDDTIRELIKYKQYSMTRQRQKNTPPQKPASTVAE